MLGTNSLFPGGPADETTVLDWGHSLKEFPVVGSQMTFLLQSLCVSSQEHARGMGHHTGLVGAPVDITTNYPHPILLPGFLLHFFWASEVLPSKDLLGTDRLLI